MYDKYIRFYILINICFKFDATLEKPSDLSSIYNRDQK